MLVVTALLNGKQTGSCLKVHTVRQKDAITSFFVGSEIQSFRNYVLPLCDDIVKFDGIEAILTALDKVFLKDETRQAFCAFGGFVLYN